MNRELADIIGIMMGLTFATLALAMLGFAGWMSAHNLHALATYRQAEGEVVSINRTSAPGARLAVHRVDVRFRACPEPPPPDPPSTPLPFRLPPPLPRFASDPGSECVPGERGRRRISADTSGPTTLKPGDAVTVYWHPAYPRDVRIGAFSTFWFTPFILGVLGLMFAIYGGLILRDLIREWRRRHRQA